MSRPGVCAESGNLVRCGTGWNDPKRKPEGLGLIRSVGGEVCFQGTMAKSEALGLIRAIDRITPARLPDRVQT